MARESVGVISVAWINFVQAFHGHYSMKKIYLIPAHCMQVAEYDMKGAFEQSKDHKTDRVR